jgi:hypothetical protein
MMPLPPLYGVIETITIFPIVLACLGSETYVSGRPRAGNRRRPLLV